MRRSRMSTRAAGCSSARATARLPTRLPSSSAGSSPATRAISHRQSGTPHRRPTPSTPSQAKPPSTSRTSTGRRPTPTRAASPAPRNTPGCASTPAGSASTSPGRRATSSACEPNHGTGSTGHPRTRPTIPLRRPEDLTEVSRVSFNSHRVPTAERDKARPPHAAPTADYFHGPGWAAGWLRCAQIVHYGNGHYLHVNVGAILNLPASCGCFALSARSAEHPAGCLVDRGQHVQQGPALGLGEARGDLVLKGLPCCQDWLLEG